MPRYEVRLQTTLVDRVDAENENDAIDKAQLYLDAAGYSRGTWEVQEIDAEDDAV